MFRTRQNLCQIHIVTSRIISDSFNSPFTIDSSHLVTSPTYQSPRIDFSHIQQLPYEYQRSLSAQPNHEVYFKESKNRKLSQTSLYQVKMNGYKSGLRQSNKKVQQKIMQNDEIYYGQLQDGKCEGLGTLYDKNGEILYIGQWKNNKYHGIGILTQDGIIRKGQFVEGNLNGEAIEETDNYKFYGFFKSNLRDGPGTLYIEDQVIQGIWNHGEQIRSS